MARVMIAFANKASMDTSRRVARKHLELARNGVPAGGNRPFGYKADKITIEPTEAALIRTAAVDVLAGVGLHTICRHWNTQGITTTRGNPWQKQVLRHMLLSPRLAGFRVYQSGIARHDDGTPVTGLYEPILDVATWERLVALITDPARGVNVHTGGRKYLLTGLMRCECGALMSGNADAKNATFNYCCRRCFIAIAGPKSDEAIKRLVLKFLAEREVYTEVEPWPHDAELAEAETRVVELMMSYTEHRISGATVFPAVERLEATIREHRAARMAWTREQSIISARPTDAARAWIDYDTDQRRSLIGGVFVAIVVSRAVARGGRFDPTRLDPIRRTTPQPGHSP